MIIICIKNHSLSKFNLKNYFYATLTKISISTHKISHLKPLDIEIWQTTVHWEIIITGIVSILNNAGFLYRNALTVIPVVIAVPEFLAFRVKFFWLLHNVRFGGTRCEMWKIFCNGKYNFIFSITCFINFRLFWLVFLTGRHSTFQSAVAFRWWTFLNFCHFFMIRRILFVVMMIGMSLKKKLC